MKITLINIVLFVGSLIFLHAELQGEVGTTSDRQAPVVYAEQGGDRPSEFDTESHIGNVSFVRYQERADTPWYKSYPIYLLNIIILGMIVYLFYRWQKISSKKIREELLSEQKKMNDKQNQKFEIDDEGTNESKLWSENKQLEIELKEKTLLLAAKAKETDEKNKIFEELKSKLLEMEAHPESTRSRIAEMLSILDAHADTDNSTFELQMDLLHQEFMQDMKEKFPGLTGNDLRLCAYIKMGFNSKEIADLLNIKPSSIYISRSRLRKKLDLQSNEDLYGFINSALG